MLETVGLTGNSARKYMLAGRAVVTVENPETGRRFTYRIEAGKRDCKELFFVSVLANGSDDDGVYTFLGTIFPDGSFRHSRKSPAGPEALSVKAFTWLWGRVHNVCNWSPVVIHHSGRCGRCGRTLTVPASILSGLGPECVTRS